MPMAVDLNPRPDIKWDSSKWATLLRLASERDEGLYGALNGIRTGGTTLKVGRTPDGKKKWVLKPIIDPTGNVAWSSLNEYEEARKNYLLPHMDDVIVLLKELEERWPPAW